MRRKQKIIPLMQCSEGRNMEPQKKDEKCLSIFHKIIFIFVISLFHRSDFYRVSV